MYATSGRNISSSAQINPGTVLGSDLANDTIGDAQIGAHTSTKITGTLIRSGVAASRPATCAVGEIYFATDTKVLSVASATNTWQSYPAALLVSGGTQGDVIYFNGTTWVVLAAGTSGYFLKTQGAGQNPVWDAAGASVVSASDTQQFAADTARTGTDTTFTLKKSIQVYYPGAIRIKWEHANNGTGDADAYIAINGLDQEAGSFHRVSGSTHTAFSYDFYVSGGDRVQLYIKSSTNYKVRNYRMCYTKAAAAVDGVVVTD